MAGTINITADPQGAVEVVQIQLPGAPGPAGPQGIPGQANVVSIGTVTTLAAGAAASATITGVSPNQVLNLKIPQGLKGDKGDPNTLVIGTVNTVDVTTGASATITGIAPNQTLNLVVPRGYGVIPGGAANTVLVKSTATDYDTAWETPTGTGSLVRNSYVDTGDSNTLTSANSHADTGDANTLASANSHADTGDAATLSSANSHADTGDTNTLASAKSYTDSTDATRKTYVDTQDTATLTSANAHADTKASIAGDLGGTAALPQVTSGAHHTHTSAQVSDATDVATANAVLKRDASAGGALEYLDLPYNTPADPGTNKGRLYVDPTTHGLTMRTSSGSVKTQNALWGSGTAFSATGFEQKGDTYFRTDIGTNGSIWHYVGGTAGVSGWVHKGLILCTSTTSPGPLYAGAERFDTDTKIEYVSDGTTWNVVAGAGMPYAQVRQATVQSGLAASTYIPITFDAEDFDSHNGHDNVTNNSRWTCPAGQGGLYAVEGVVVFAGGGACFTVVTKNGTAFNGSYGSGLTSAGGGTSVMPTGRKLVTLAAGDYLGLQGMMTTASWGTSTNANSFTSMLTIERIR